MNRLPRVLFIEDEEYFLNTVLSELKSISIVESATNLEQALNLIRQKDFDILITDLNLGQGLEGIEILKQAELKNSSIVSVVLTSHKDDEIVLACSQCNCNHFFYKPNFLKDRKSILNSIIKSTDNNLISKFFSERYVTSHETLKDQISKLLRSSLPKDSNIMILGPTGVGKSALVKQLHLFWHETDSNFSHCNLKELSEDIIESEMFGSVAGAFTGAIDKEGLFEKADGGTLFLDEIATLPLSIQVKLLNVLQNREFSRVGCTKKIPLNCRLITATCEDLAQKIQTNQLRQDFFRRIMGYTINIPSLKDRKQDIPFYIDLFRKANSRQVHITDEAMTALIGYDWSIGNVGEVKSVVDSLCNLTENLIVKYSDLPLEIRENVNPYDRYTKTKYLSDGVINDIFNQLQDSKPFNQIMKEIESEVFGHLTLEKGFNTYKASKLMKISWDKANKISNRIQ